MATVRQPTAGAASGGERDDDELREEIAGSAGRINWRQVLPVTAVPFARYLTNSMLTVMEPFMTQQLLHLSAHQIGFYSSFMIMMGFLGAMIGNATLAMAAEYIGRRKVLFISLISASIFCFLFGVAQSFWWALLARFAWGLSYGNQAVVTTLLCESSRRQHRPRLFSLRGVWCSIGRIVGPVIAGFLSQPAMKYQALNTAFFRRVPFLLPCLIIIAVYALLFVSLLCCVTETHPHMKPGDSVCPVVEDVDGDKDAMGEDTVLGIDRRKFLMSSLADGGGDDDGVDEWNALPWYKQPCVWLARRAPVRRTRYVGLDRDFGAGRAGCRQRCRVQCARMLRKLKALLRYYVAAYRADTVNVTVLCMVLLWGVATQSSTAVMALILLQRPARGGFCMDSAHLGLMVTMGSFASLVIQLVFYPPLARRISLRRLVCVPAFALAVALIILPWLSTWFIPLYRANSEGVYNVTVPVVVLHQRGLPGYHRRASDQELLERIDGKEVSSVAPYLRAADTSQQRWDEFEAQPVVKRARISETDAIDDDPDSPGPEGEEHDILMRSKAARHKWKCPVRRKSPGSKHGGNPRWSFKITSIAFMSVPVWVLLVLHVALIYVFRGVAGTTCSVLLNNATKNVYRVRVNAVAEIGLSMATFVGPPLASVLFAWGTTNNLSFPLNYHLIFWILGYILFAAAFVSQLLPRSVEIQFEEEDAIS